jgi:hypothetical protein
MVKAQILFRKIALTQNTLASSPEWRPSDNGSGDPQMCERRNFTTAETTRRRTHCYQIIFKITRQKSGSEKRKCKSMATNLFLTRTQFNNYLKYVQNVCNIW